MIQEDISSLPNSVVTNRNITLDTNKYLTPYNSPLIIDSCEFSSVVNKLREFFVKKGFVEVHTQNRLSILAACEDPFTVSTFNYTNMIWPLPQTGQMWLEYELLKNPTVPGYFCVSTSYRNEPNPVPGRHDLIFPMFEVHHLEILTCNASKHYYHDTDTPLMADQ